MKRSAWRLAATASLFVLWLCYLAYLAATTTEPVVLERPQFLVADLYVLADVDAASSTPLETATVRKVVWAADPADQNLDKIKVKNLAKCGVKKQPKDGGVLNFPGPGEYILALSHTKEPNVFMVTLEPRTPGFPGHALQAQMELVGAPIYPVTPQSLQQLQIIKTEFHSSP
jgi:hypothetical protein